MTTRSKNTIDEEDWKQNFLTSTDKVVVQEAFVRALLKQPRGTPFPNILSDAVKLVLPELPVLDKKWEGIPVNNFKKSLCTAYESLYDNVRYLIKDKAEAIETSVNLRRPEQQQAVA